MLIHQGTQIICQFSKVDVAGNVIETYTVTPQKDKPDPLMIKVFSEEAFVQAFQTLVRVKQQLEEPNLVVREFNNKPQ